MTKESFGAASAFDASVYSDSRETGPSERETVTASAVDYFERELESMEAGIVRLQAKREKFQAHLDAVTVSIEESEQARSDLEQQLESAKQQLSELIDAEVDA